MYIDNGIYSILILCSAFLIKTFELIQSSADFGVYITPTPCPKSVSF